MLRRVQIVLLVACLSGCSKEARELGPTLPQTPPAGDDDARVSAYEDDFYQLSQGGRYFSWYGCARCHTDDATGELNLADGRWYRGGGFARIYGAISDRHGRLGYGARIPVEQLWQLTAYVRDLPKHHPEKRRRVALDQQSEPQASTWSGPQ